MYVCACYVSSGVVVAAALDINAYMFVNKNKYFNNSLPPLVVDTHATTTEIPPAVFTDSVTNIYEASTGCIPAVDAYDSFLIFYFFFSIVFFSQHFPLSVKLLYARTSATIMCVWVRLVTTQAKV